MIRLLSILDKKSAQIIAIVIAVALFYSCASNNTADLRPGGSKHITDLIISENSTSLILTIKGDRALTCTEMQPPLRKGVLLDFPDTRPAIAKQTYIPPDNEIISSIKVDEVLTDQTTTASILIALKRDATYSLKSDQAGLQVSFSKVTGTVTDAQPQKKLAGKNREAKSIRKQAQSATELIAVAAGESKDHLVVDVKADGAIRDYRSFVIDNPARIVFDMYKIRSSYKKQQVITVTSKWATRIRYFGYPDKVRLVLETHSNYLSNYSALPTDTGLVISVGKIHAASTAIESKPD
jgi:type IV pilus assembly protein PilQ